MTPAQTGTGTTGRGEITYRRGSGHTYWRGGGGGGGGAAAAQRLTASAAWWQVFVLACANLRQSGKGQTSLIHTSDNSTPSPVD